jgi:hypothetical protein
MKYLFLALLLIATPTHALKFVQSQIITAGDMSAATINSAGQDIQNVPLGAIHAVWTGAPVGTIIVQASADLTSTAASVVNWTTVSGSTVAVSGAGDVMINFSNVGYKWMRLQYTKTSGTGTLNAILDTKGDY